MKRILTSLLLLLALASVPQAFGQQFINSANFQGPKGGIAALALSPDGTTLAIAGKDRSVTLWHAVHGKTLNTLDCKGAAVVSLTFSANGKTLASRDSENQVRLWDVPSGMDVTKCLLAHGAGKGEPFVGGKLEAGVLTLNANGVTALAYVASGIIKKETVAPGGSRP